MLSEMLAPLLPRAVRVCAGCLPPGLTRSCETSVGRICPEPLYFPDAGYLRSSCASQAKVSAQTCQSRRLNSSR